ncbi:alpha/beta hydrolase [Gimesia algae]|uniref:Esterase n=1 Tax=Gimesia algae TaxID=2527971 RepID=A0A517VLN0_9PLAN|nr:alpha/beta fold hydrolase [Gimesia algae]QDT93916.1 esterase [Gimesia algae]
MSWLLWCVLIAIAVEIIIQYCIMRAAYPVLFAPMPDRFNLIGTLAQLPENDDHIQIRDVTFPTTDGLTLHGFIATPAGTLPKGVILFCHPFKSTGRIALFQCQGLLEAGFAVFSFDFRNHGESDNDVRYQSIHWLSQYELNDARSAIKYLRTQPELSHLPLGMLGMSRGAGTALAVAAKAPEIQFVACEGAFLNEELFLDHAIRWGERFLPRLFIQIVPTSEVIRAFRIMIWYSQRRQGCRYINLKPRVKDLKNRNLLFFTGEKDQSVVPRMTQLIVKRIHNTHITVCSLPGAIHNAGRFAQLEKFDAALIDFFSQMIENGSEEKELGFPEPLMGPADPVPSKRSA